MKNRGIVFVAVCAVSWSCGGNQTPPDQVPKEDGETAIADTPFYGIPTDIENPCADIEVPEDLPQLTAGGSYYSGDYRVAGGGRTTWDNSEHVVFDAGTRLFVEPGGSLNFGWNCGGSGRHTTAEFRGTEEAPILVCPADTSVSEGKFAPASWNGVSLRCGAATGSSLENVVIVGGGAKEGTSGLELGSEVRLNNVAVLGSGDMGVRARVFGENSTNLVVAGTEKTTMEVLTTEGLSRIPEGSYGANAFPGIDVRLSGGDRAEFHNRGVPYRIVEHLRFGSSQRHQSVTIHAGVELQFAPKTGLDVGFRSDYTTLRILGTPDNPVRFTALAGSDAAPGAWRGLVLDSGTLGNSVIQNLIVEYAGERGPALVVGRPVQLNNVVVGGSAGAPISLNEKQPAWGTGVRVVGLLEDVDTSKAPETLQIEFIEQNPEEYRPLAAIPTGNADAGQLEQIDKIDLVAMDITTHPVLGPGRTEKAQIRVKNPHPKLEATNVQIAVSFCPGGRIQQCETAGSTTIPAIGPGETQTGEVEFETPEGATIGRHGVLISVDPKDAVAEYSELNNQAVFLFDLNNKPNLKVEELRLSSSDVTEADTLTMTARISNTGAVASVSTPGRFKLQTTNGVTIAEFGTPNIPAIEPRESFVAEATYTLPRVEQDGQFQVAFVVDENLANTELDEKDNQQVRALSVTEPLDGEISAQWSETDPKKLVVTITNPSTKPMARPIVFQIETMDGDLVGAPLTHMTALVESSATRVFDLSARPSGEKLKAILDYANNEEPETRQANNSALVTVP